MAGPGASTDEGPRWSEEDSQDFLQYGAMFVPHRETQLEILSRLAGGEGRPFEVLELGCGAGLLADRLLERWPSVRVTGLDASTRMLDAARAKTALHGERFRALAGRIDEAPGIWGGGELHAIVSSLALHHLEDAAKRQLFAWAADVLAPGGVLAIADLIRPLDARGKAIAAQQWDAAVASECERNGHPQALEVFRDEGWNMYALDAPDPEDRPASLYDQLRWLRQAGFVSADVHWLFAGHAIFAGTTATEPG